MNDVLVSVRAISAAGGFGYCYRPPLLRRISIDAASSCIEAVCTCLSESRFSDARISCLCCMHVIQVHRSVA